jgi:hypothetical protein
MGSRVSDPPLVSLSPSSGLAAGPETYMRQFTTLFATSAFCLALAGAASADIIFDNGAPLTDNGGSEASRWVQAQDFSFAAGASVSGASVYIGFADLLPNAQPFDGPFEYWLFADGGGQPGAVLDNGVAQATAAPVAPWNYSYSTSDILRLDIDFGTPFAAAAGQTYWFGFRLDDDYTRDQLYWMWSETNLDRDGELKFQGNGHAAFMGDFGDWEQGDYEHAFQLHGTAAAVPEPATWAMMILGFGAAGALMRRRRYAVV